MRRWPALKYTMCSDLFKSSRIKSRGGYLYKPIGRAEFNGTVPRKLKNIYMYTEFACP